MPALPLPRRLDVALALAVAAGAVTELALGAVEGPLAVSLPASLAGTLSLAWRVVAPRAVFAVVVLAVSAQSLFDVPLASISVLLAMLVAAYSLARHCELRSALSLAVAGLAVQSLALSGLDAASPADLVFDVVLIGAPFLAGSALRSREVYTAALAERAVLLERERDERARAAVASERTRIARELHDVIAHNLSVAIIQTVAARGLVDEPSPVAVRMTAVESSCRRALEEMRRLLGVLGQDGAAPLAPAVGMSAVGDLVDGVRQAGLPVEFETAGTPADLPEGLDVALYRVAQEALTNALRYSGGASTRLTVRYAADTVEVEVEDDGPRAPIPERGTGGRGLIGMRERVALYGGSLVAAPRQEGGFRVHARVPLAQS